MRDRVWGITFLETSTMIPRKDVSKLLAIATGMFYDKREELVVTSDNFVGKLYNTGKYCTLGRYGGIRFRAELQTPKGKENLSFLVSEQGGGAFTYNNGQN